MRLNIFQCTMLAFPRPRCDRPPREGIGPIDKCESGQDGCCISEINVNARGTTTLCRIVHGGKVVKQERGGMEVFKTDRHVDGESFRELKA